MRVLTRWPHSVRLLLGLLLVALMGVGVGSVALSLWASRAQGHDTIVANVLGRQRMLGQRMLRYLASGTGSAGSDAAEFERHLDVLRRGGAASVGGALVRLPREEDPRYQRALDEVEREWRRFERVALQSSWDGVEAAGDSLLIELDRALATYSAVSAERVRQQRLALLAFLGVGGALLAVAYWLVRFEVVRPVLALERAVRRMRSGDYGEAAHVKPRNELGELATAFNDMASHIEYRLREQDNLLQLSRALLAAEQPDAVAEALFDALAGHCAPVAQGFLMVTPDTKALELAASRGWSEERRAAAGLHLDSLPESAVTQAARSGELRVLARSADDPYWQAAPGVPDRARGAAVVPITAGEGAPSALLLLDLSDAARASGAHAGYLRLAAHLTATALVRVRHQLARAAAEERARALFRGSPLGLYRSTREGLIVDANPAFARLLGHLDPSEIVGSPINAFYAELEDRESWRATLEERGTLAGWEVRFRRVDGEMIWVRNSARLVVSAAGVVCYEGVLEDVTARRAAEERRRASEAKLHGIVSLAADAIIAIDARGEIVIFNEGAERIFGYSAVEVMGSPLELLLPVSARAGHGARVRGFGEAPERSRRMGERATILGRRRDGSEFPAEASISKLEVGGERLYATVLRDVSDRKRMEERLLESSRAAALGTLAGGTAHFFNNLLMVVQGHCALLLDDASPGDPRRDDLLAIEDAVGRAAALTRQLLAFTRQQVLAPQRIEPNRAIVEAAPLLRNLLGAEVRLALELDAAAGWVDADPDSLGQVLVELALNARDAMPHGGTLHIATGRAEIDERAAEQHDLTPGAYLAIRITDDGIGMSAEVRRQALDPFFTTKGRALTPGLGLSTAYGIVRQSGGTLILASVPGRGTTVTFLIPSAEAPDALAVALPAPPRPRALVGSGEPREAHTILVVEDEPTLRLLLRRVLERAGHRVLLASDGLEGLELAARHEAPLALLLTDVVMPGMGGPALYERLLARQPDLPAIFTSGYAEEEIASSGRLMPGVTFLAKPFGADELVRAVESVLAERLAAPPA